MSQQEKNRMILLKYIPEKSVDLITEWIYHFDFKLKIKKRRNSKYGDYRSPVAGKNHQITINRDMNKYAFLITLIHEIAHLTNWNKHKNKVKPHGEEWKQEYQQLMNSFLKEDIFPSDIINALNKYMKNPAASSCSDLTLMRVLKNYDGNENMIFLEEIPEKTIFKIHTGRYFVKGEKIRTRYRCKELKTNKEYLFNPLAEVFLA